MSKLSSSSGLLILSLFSLLPVEAGGQEVLPIWTSVDLAEIPAIAPTMAALYINHHEVSSQLILRSVLETSNGLLHDAAAAAGIEYRDVKIDLDQYTRAFEWLDAVLGGLSVASHAVRVYEHVSEDITALGKLYETYADIVINHGGMKSADERIFEAAEDAVKGLKSDLDNMVASLKSMSMYTSVPIAGLEQPASCTAATLSYITSEIDVFLSSIEDRIHNLYNTTYVYIRIRTSFWKDEVMRRHTVSEISTAALERWRKNATDAFSIGGGLPRRPDDLEEEDFSGSRGQATLK